MLERVADDEPGPAAVWGQEVHKFVETGEATERVAKWLAEVTDDPAALREEWWPGGEHEILLRLDEDGTCSIKGACGDEDKEKFFDGGMVRGIADWVGQSVVPHIVDLKTGRHPPPSSPAETPQLLFYALVWLRLHSREPGVMLSLDHWPRYPKGQEPTRTTDYVSRADVEAWYRRRLLPARRLSVLPEAKTDARPGPWCQYCRCAPWCPAV